MGMRRTPAREDNFSLRKSNVCDGPWRTQARRGINMEQEYAVQMDLPRASVGEVSRRGGQERAFGLRIPARD